MEVASGPAGRLHAESAELVAGPSGRLIRLVNAEAPALVLGSSQPERHVDWDAAAAAGIPVVRRRSGGGAVLVGPAEVVWVDVVVPAGDPLSSDDVGQAAWWLGDCWAAAVRSVTGTDAQPSGAQPSGAQPYRGAMVRTAWSGHVCFAGLGPGEVTAGGAKVVGVSQRRTRYGALFQTAALLRWQPEAMLGLLALTPAERAEAAAALDGAATGVGAGAGEALADAVVAAIRAF